MTDNTVFTIYLAGKMSGLTHEEMNGWRKAVDKCGRIQFKKAYPYCNSKIRCINPVDFYNFKMERNFTHKEVKKFDLKAVEKSDIVLVNLSHNSIGTAMELHHANINNIPVIGFNAILDEGDINRTHEWILESVDKFCDNKEDAVQYIINYYCNIL